MQALVCFWCAGGAESSFMRQVCADGSLTRTYFILLPRPLRPYGLRSVSRRMVSVFVPSSARMPPEGVFPFHLRKQQSHKKYFYRQYSKTDFFTSPVSSYRRYVRNLMNIQVLVFTQQFFCPLGSECFEIRSEYFFE